MGKLHRKPASFAINFVSADMYLRKRERLGNLHELPPESRQKQESILSLLPLPFQGMGQNAAFSTLPLAKNAGTFRFPYANKANLRKGKIGSERCSTDTTWMDRCFFSLS